MGEGAVRSLFPVCLIAVARSLPYCTHHPHFNSISRTARAVSSLLWRPPLPPFPRVPRRFACISGFRWRRAARLLPLHRQSLEATMETLSAAVRTVQVGCCAACTSRYFFWLSHLSLFSSVPASKWLPPTSCCPSNLSSPASKISFIRSSLEHVVAHSLAESGVDE